MMDLTLTFDNGPKPETTPVVLDVLARRSIRATFFVIGRKLNTHDGRELAQRAHAEGHWIGNHTWTHSLPLGLLKDARAIGQEIRETQQAIGALAHPHRFFRPFGQGGNLDERLLPNAAEMQNGSRWRWPSSYSSASGIPSSSARARPGTMHRGDYERLAEKRNTGLMSALIFKRAPIGQIKSYLLRRNRRWIRGRAASDLRKRCGDRQQLLLGAGDHCFPLDAESQPYGDVAALGVLTEFDRSTP